MKNSAFRAVVLTLVAVFSLNGSVHAALGTMVKETTPLKKSLSAYKTVAVKVVSSTKEKAGLVEYAQKQFVEVATKSGLFASVVADSPSAKTDLVLTLDLIGKSKKVFSVSMAAGNGWYDVGGELKEVATGEMLSVFKTRGVLGSSEVSMGSLSMELDDATKQARGAIDYVCNDIIKYFKKHK